MCTGPITSASPNVNESSWALAGAATTRAAATAAANVRKRLNLPSLRRWTSRTTLPRVPLRRDRSIVHCESVLRLDLLAGELLARHHLRAIRRSRRSHAFRGRCQSAARGNRSTDRWATTAAQPRVEPSAGARCAPASVAVLGPVVVDDVPEAVRVGAAVAGEHDRGRGAGDAATRSQARDERVHGLPAVV